MSMVWLMPGQGMERTGMGLELADAFSCAASLLDAASAAAGCDLRRWLRSPGRDAERTEHVQPALTAVALGAAAALLEAGLTPDLVAGHSLGELAAWSVAGGCDAVDAVGVAAVRGAAMAAAAAASPGGMRAVPWPAPVAAGLVLAVENPDVALLSGGSAALAAFGGGARVATGGAWHSPAMRPAEPAVRAALDALPRSPLRHGLVSHAHGALVDDAQARIALASLSSPVRWRAVLATLGAQGVRTAVILGPSKVLRHHLRLALPDVAVVAVERAADVDLARSALGREGAANADPG